MIVTIFTNTVSGNIELINFMFHYHILPTNIACNKKSVKIGKNRQTQQVLKHEQSKLHFIFPLICCVTLFDFRRVTSYSSLNLFSAITAELAGISKWSEPINWIASTMVYFDNHIYYITAWNLLSGITEAAQLSSFG